MTPWANIADTVPQPFMVGGIVLKPFSLGHHILFKVCSLPFAGNAEADCGLDDILLGSVLCGLTYEDALAELSSGRMPKLIRKWRRRTIASRWPLPRFEPPDIEAQFRDYLRNGYARPPVWTHTGSGLSLSAPWEMLVKLKLTQYGFSEREILSGYLPAMMFAYYSALEWDQVRECQDLKSWKRVFYTREDWEKINGNT